MRHMRFALLLLTISSPAAAQIVELGAGIGRGCIGDSSGFCGDEAGPMWATQASVWLDDRLELGIRLAILPLSDLSRSIQRDDRFNAVDDPAIRLLPQIDVAEEYRSRRIVSGEAIYHFARGSSVRTFLGAGIGEQWNRGFTTCLPAGCERLAGMLRSPVGWSSGHIGTLSIIAGVSGRVGRRVQVRGGVRLHNFAGEGAATTEVFIATGYRLGGM